MSQRIRHALFLLMGACAVCVMPARAQTQGGMSLGDSGWFLGGYAAASYRDFSGQDPALVFDSLSGFLWWEGASRWSVFGELELQDALQLTPGDSTTRDAYPALERLHVDYAWSDALRLRAGKFLTPVGRWNLIHAAPLTWTTARPLITEATFPTNATGVMLQGVRAVAGQALEWSLYASPGHELFPEPGLDTFSEAYGLHVNYALLPGLELGLSAVEFEQEFEKDEHKRLLGADLLWRWRRMELMSEWAVRTLSDGARETDERGFYVQAVVPVYGEVYAVGRYETFQPANHGDDYRLALGGLTWRVRPGVVLKADYTGSTQDVPEIAEGLRASVAVLF